MNAAIADTMKSSKGTILVIVVMRLISAAVCTPLNTKL
ncbi:Uncharacterised protein [Vibrio cholerae]|nr:Uncharacterised protein [Vibrio cholerae]